MTIIYRSPEGAMAVRDAYQAVLERWPVPNEHLTVPTRQGETFVVACGPADAPPVILLHGSTSNSSAWMGDVPDWSERSRLYAVDVIGEPGLSAPTRPPMDSDAYAGWLDDVLDGLGLERAAVVGMSLGGWLAADYASRRPERVDRLVLLCPAGIGRQKIAKVLVAVLLLRFGPRGRRAALKLMLGAAPPTTTAEERAFADFLTLIQRNFKPRLQLPVFDDAALRRLTMPVLVVLGGRDAMIDSAGTRRRLTATVPHATVEYLPEEGHLLLGQTGTVLRFLRP